MWVSGVKIDYKAVGKRIKIARINLDMTQEELSEKVQLSPSHMSNIETGTTRMSLQTVVNIANALNVSVDQLLADSVVQARPILESELQEILADCTPEELRVIAEVATAAKAAIRRNFAQGTKN